ncbi:MAG: thiamine phosphate synthase [Nitrospirae bacterium]|nr:thiamine phosphate synthase [Nitrospirota bacterium]
MTSLPSRICFIISPAADSTDAERYVLESARCALNAGILWIQYREKYASRRAIYSTALRLRELTKQFSACLIINDHTDISLAVEADGVHLGQEDLPLKEARKLLPNKIIGISTHNKDEASEAEKGGADYIGFGSIFPTTTKEIGSPKGPDVIKQIKNAVSIPIIAIGGINVGNAASVFNAGAYGIAVSSGISQGNIEQNVKQLLSVRR